MRVDLENAFRLSFVAGEAELKIPAVWEILARLRSGPVWDVASSLTLQNGTKHDEGGCRHDHQDH